MYFNDSRDKMVYNKWSHKFNEISQNADFCSMWNGYFNCFFLRCLSIASRGKFFGHWKISEFLKESGSEFTKISVTFELLTSQFYKYKINEFYCNKCRWSGLLRGMLAGPHGSRWHHPGMRINTSCKWTLCSFSEQCELVQEINALPQIILNWFIVKAYFLSYSLFYWK